MTPFHLRAWAKRPDICTIGERESVYFCGRECRFKCALRAHAARRAKEFSFWTRTTVLLLSGELKFAATRSDRLSPRKTSQVPLTILKLLSYSYLCVEMVGFYTTK